MSQAESTNNAPGGEVMSAGAAGAAAAAAAIAQAIKASGVLVRVEPAQFEAIVGRTRAPLVVTATGGLFTTNYQYLTSYKGLAFFTKSPSLIPLPGDAELIVAGKIVIPG
jgi:hypothetical protein